MRSIRTPEAVTDVLGLGTALSPGKEAVAGCDLGHCTGFSQELVFEPDQPDLSAAAATACRALRLRSSDDV